MEFIIDTADLAEIKEAIEVFPIVGVTSNPSIIKRVQPKDFIEHMKEIRIMIGLNRSLHIQVIATEYEHIMEEAHHILNEVDQHVFIKIPVTYDGIRAIKRLKLEGVQVTATAVYDIMQAYLALAAGADYIAPYVNRIGNLGGDPYDLISQLSNRIFTDGYECKIVAASFKGVQQVRDCFQYGTHAVTVPVEILHTIFNNPNIEKAITDFNNDWYSMYGEGHGILDV